MLKMYVLEPSKTNNRNKPMESFQRLRHPFLQSRANIWMPEQQALLSHLLFYIHKSSRAGGGWTCAGWNVEIHERFSSFLRERPVPRPARSNGKSFTSHLDKEFGLMEVVPSSLQKPLTTASHLYKHNSHKVTLCCFILEWLSGFLFSFEVLQWMRP